MNDKKKILLGDKDILSRDNEDLFINLSLSSSFNDIRNDKFDNVFDVDKQFKKERNSCRNFKVYGTIDSTVTDCNNLTIQVFSDSGTTGLYNLLAVSASTSLIYEEKNVYGKKRGKYVIDLENYNKDFIYIKIPSNSLNYKDQIYTQQLIFRDSEGTFVEYGTQTLDIDDNGNTIEISNDFYFLFNKHWIKKSLSIIEEKPAKIFINTNDTEAPTINEASTPADRISIIVSLDKPSPFGLEKADIGVLQTTLDTSEIVFTDFNFNFLTLPHTISFGVGEQNKLFYFYSPLDTIQESLEGVTFELTNFQSVNTGSPLNYSVNVEDKTPRNIIRLNFQDVYENRNYFTGRVGTGGTSSSVMKFSRPMPSVLRNGLFFEGTPMEFYPSDGYTLKIKNVGVNTILPVNSILGITEEKLFLTNQEYTFNIKQEYTNTDLHSIKLTFKTLNGFSNHPTHYSYEDGFVINGVPIVKYGYNFEISYQHFLAYLTKSPGPGTSYTIDGWSYSSFDTPFTVVGNSQDLTITLTAKNPGTRLDLSTYGFLLPELFTITDDDFDTYGIKAEIVQEFVYSAQTPLVIELGANYGGNLYGQYQFTISKNGYDTMQFTCSPVQAAINPDTYYLISGLNTVLRNWNDSNSTIVYKHDKVTSDWGVNALATNPTYGQYKTGDVYINGMVLLANLYLSNTLYYSSNPQGNTALNSSHAINSSGDLSHDFYPDPIIVIPETISDLALTSTAQMGFLGISRPTGLPVLPTNLNMHRSFEFRHGTSGPYNTYSFVDQYSFGQTLWINGQFYSSGGTAGTNRPEGPGVSGLSLKTYLETGSVSFSITDQDMVGVTNWTSSDYNTYISPNITIGGSVYSDWIKLTSATPGIPFEFTNFREMQNTSTHNDYYNHSTIQFIEVTPNQTAGVTLNLGNNHMGGYTVTHP